MEAIQRSVTGFVSLVVGISAVSAFADGGTTSSGDAALVSQLAAKDGIACKLSDVRVWRAVGSRWASGYDSGGKLLAIYDLSFPSLRDRAGLNSIGSPVSAEEIAAVVAEARAEEAETAEERAETDQALAELQSEVSSKASRNPLPPGWWKTVPWKASAAAFASADSVAPVEFTLGDVDIKRAVKKEKDYTAAVRAAEHALTEVEETEFSMDDFYARVHFRRESDGTYAISVDGLSTVSMPRRVAGVACVKDGMRYRRAWDLFRVIAKALVKQASSQAVSVIFGTALSRYSYYQSLKLQSHEQMLLEHLNAAAREEGGPFADLSGDERLAAATSVLLTQEGTTAALLRILRKPRGSWTKLLKQELALGSQAARWMDRHDRVAAPLNSRFAMATDRELPKSVLIYPVRKAAHKGPAVAVDYAKPDAIRRSRQWKEAQIIAVDIGSRFIPIFGSLINGVHRRLVERPMTLAKLWEARLTSHLEERALSSEGESAEWNDELEILDRQRINPLELTRANSAQLIAARRARLGI